MIIDQNNNWHTNTLYPDTDWTGKAKYVLPDNSDIAEKIMSCKNEFEITEKSGEIIDVIPINETDEQTDLLSELEQTDYRIIKCYEYALVGKEMPYDINELHTKREELRDKINRMEEKE